MSESKKSHRWSDSPKYALTIFLLSLLALAAANWGYRHYQRYREAERLALITRHYQNELNNQMDAMEKQSEAPPETPK